MAFAAAGVEDVGPEFESGGFEADGRIGGEAGVVVECSGEVGELIWGECFLIIEEDERLDEYACDAFGSELMCQRDAAALGLDEDERLVEPLNKGVGFASIEGAQVAERGGERGAADARAPSAEWAVIHHDERRWAGDDRDRWLVGGCEFEESIEGFEAAGFDVVGGVPGEFEVRAARRIFGVRVGPEAGYGWEAG